MGEEREAVVIVCKTGDQIVHHMNDKQIEKQKRYNTFKWSLDIITKFGVIFSVVVLLVAGSAWLFVIGH